MPRTTQEIIDHADELAKRFEDYTPKAQDRRDPKALAELRAAVVARADAEKAIAERVAAAKHAGYSWSAIGAEIGTSGEAVRQRYAAKATRPQ